MNVKLIMLNEVKTMIRNKVVIALILLLLSLLVLSVLSGVGYYNSNYQLHNEAKELARLQWETQGDKNPHSAAHYGTHAFKPITVLSVFDPGVDHYTGGTLFLEAHHRNFAAYSQAEDTEASRRFAELTPAFIFAYLVPLFIIFIGYRSISSEKESGMYKFLKSQGVERSHILFGKSLGLWFVVAILVLPFFLLGLVMIFSSTSDMIDIIRFIVYCIVWILYFGIVTHIAIIISSVTRNSSTSMVVLLTIWIISTLLIPRMITNLAGSFYPVPNTNEFYESVSNDLAMGIDGHNPFSEFTAAFRDSVLSAHGVQEVSELPFNFSGMMLQESEEFEKSIFDYHFANIDDIHQKQIRLLSISSIFSPTIAVRHASMSLAGTDMYAFNHFLNEAEEYRISLMRELNMDLKNNAVGERATGYTAGNDFFARNIPFEYHRPESILHNSEQWTTLYIVGFWFSLSILILIFVSNRKEYS